MPSAGQSGKALWWGIPALLLVAVSLGLWMQGPSKLRMMEDLRAQATKADSSNKVTVGNAWKWDDLSKTI